MENLNDKKTTKKKQKEKKSKEKKNKKNLNHNPNAISVDRIFREAIDHIFRDLIENEDILQYVFPCSLSRVERLYIHTIATRFDGFRTRSKGKGSERFITIFKQVQKKKIADDMRSLQLTDSIRSEFKQLLNTNPVSFDDLKQLKDGFSMKKRQNLDCSLASQSTRFQLNPPPHAQNSMLQQQRQQLPITNYRDHILDIINRNQVVVISAETGAGKSTQVPQYILEDCAQRRQCCKIICTQPRRVAAIAVSQRVAQERNEKLGLTVGYQIRLESQMSPRSNLIYTTTGYFLRCLVSGNMDSFFNGTTHIILDEIHERDKHSDFLLIAIREQLPKYTNTKVILMSATLDSKIFSEYFGNCPIIEVPGRMFPVTVYHLNHILRLTGHGNEPNNNKNKKTNQCDAAKSNRNEIDGIINLDKDLASYVNKILEECWCSMDEATDAFDQFYYLVTGENVPIDIKHTETNLNALMIAAGKGLSETVSTLLQMGADPMVTGAYEQTALEWAKALKQDDCVEILQEFIIAQQQQSENLQKIEDGPMVQKYLNTINEDDVDHDLLSSIIIQIHRKMAAGSILVFLPGYEDIVEQKDSILNYLDELKLTGTVEILILHSSMQVTDQRKVFIQMPDGIRKIILSTNIAETSITIDDVVYVVDSGKVKQKSFDALSGSTSLRSTWISKACATQRTGRAGRTQPGICYRLFTQERFGQMDAFTLPEILRVPLPEICLHTKILSRNTSIIEFLTKAVQAPPIMNIKQSIRLLQDIGALDESENITELGVRLTDIPLDVQLAKALLYSVFFNCLDPVLTIVSALSVKDPFILTPSMDRESSNANRNAFAMETYSDHMITLKTFQDWMLAKTRGQERAFCRKASISNGTMELICGTRAHILGCLRSLKIANYSLNNINRNSSNWALVKACLTVGLYPNVCYIQKKRGQFQSQSENRLMPHPSAVLKDFNMKRFRQILQQLPIDWIVFGEKTNYNKMFYVRYNTVVSSLMVALFCGPIYLSDEAIEIIPQKMELNNGIDGDDLDDNDDDDDDDDDDDVEEDEDDDETDEPNLILHIDKWIKFRSDVETINSIRDVRHKINVAFVRMLTDMRTKNNAETERIVSTVANLLLNDDLQMDLPQPACVGYRPVAVKLNFGADLNFGIDEKSIIPSHTNMNHHQPHQTQVIYTKSNQSTSAVNAIQQLNASIRRELLQGDWMKTNKWQFFVIHSQTKADVLNSLSNCDWKFDTMTLNNLLKIKKANEDVRLILFFYITKAQSFCSVAELIGTSQYNYGLRSLSTMEVSIKEPRNELPRLIKTIAKLLPPSKHGSEIDDYTKVKPLLDLLLQKDRFFNN